jgi:hypothetical protein
MFIFIIAIVIPDIIRESYFGLPQERIEELLIFILGITGFLSFIIKEHQLEVQKAEKLKEQKRLQRTAKELVDSYSYIGEVNRKMDMLMQVGANLSESGSFNRKKECEILRSIIDAAIFLLRGKCATLIFYETASQKVVEQFCSDEKCKLSQRNSDFFRMDDNVYLKTMDDYLIFVSKIDMKGIKSYLAIKNFDEFQAQDNNNQEIIKYLATQALFVYANLLRMMRNK